MQTYVLYTHTYTHISTSLNGFHLSFVTFHSVCEFYNVYSIEAVRLFFNAFNCQRCVLMICVVFSNVFFSIIFMLYFKCRRHISIFRFSRRNIDDKLRKIKQNSFDWLIKDLAPLWIRFTFWCVKMSYSVNK